MDIPATQNAVSMAQFPKEVEKWIWKKKINGISVPTLPGAVQKATRFSVKS